MQSQETSVERMSSTEGEDIMIQVGKQIEKMLVTRPSLSLSALAKSARMGAARLEKIVYHNASPSIAELERLAHALGVEPSFLVEEEPVPVETPLDPELIKLLQEPTLAVSLWGLGQLPDEDRRAITHIIQSFAAS